MSYWEKCVGGGEGGVGGGEVNSFPNVCLVSNTKKIDI